MKMIQSYQYSYNIYLCIFIYCLAAATSLPCSPSAAKQLSFIMLYCISTVSPGVL